MACLLLLRRRPSPARNQHEPFRVSKLISKETLDILYGENIFVLQFWGKPQLYIEYITEANRARIRHLLVMPAWPCCHDLRARPSPHDPSLWVPLLADLKQLRLILGYPWFRCILMSVILGLRQMRIGSSSG
ncbi:hypothetical protein ASPWEDRAFT_175223 [Aspergillus wentii DTO 134E9]|uniref:Uncharacterized protein n=1 Tax=Aspergillus wentii DTO 134E9 TaxID=1073089 RepID=A0A1L9RAF6_ASPWE|nr:uncharacterized protein ASPWEDRAFT_175223 [Aspergillus wentii DTO 134E9]OJJ31904.1 hypothetical protein ASPWEDRAFT_175223 [Aspergillus wentii DTO 134E9]